MTGLDKLCRVAAIINCILFLAATSFSDEWKASHGLVSVTGVMNLTEPPPPSEVFFSGPDSPAQAAGWREGLKAWRTDRRVRLRYDGAQYDRPDLEWTQHIFLQVQILIWDRSLYDPDRGEYTVDRFLNETEQRLGKIDAVLIWHVYPNLGVDSRNQFDLLQDLPGGLPGLRHLIDQFHDRGVKVFFPLLAWDTGTRDQGDLASSISKELKDIGADGINFDTLETVPASFRQASDAVGARLALEPQFQPRDESVAWTNISWNDWVTWEGKQYPFIPMVSKTKWLEPRHTVSVTDRFTRDKTDGLQHAFFNGQGYAVLENLWGFWYGMNPNDAESVLRFTTIESAMADNLRSPDWEPHSATLQDGVFASRFPSHASTLWTIINRNEYDVAGPQLRVPYHAGLHFYDLWHGSELKPEMKGREAMLSFEIEGRGFGALLATDENPAEGRLKDILAFMARRSRRPLSSFSREWKAVPQSIVETKATNPASAAPPGMVMIPPGDYNFQVHGIEIEGGNDPGVDVQYPWENSPRRYHNRPMHVSRFYIDRTLVTNAEFAKFISATHYHPKDDHNFLRDWKDGHCPEGWEEKPVTWVSIEDARAYATWAGKRLPHEWEWQYAAQSTDGRIYPWGSDWKAKAVPESDHGRNAAPLADVAEFPANVSPFGVLELVGNVLQWTDEYRDDHTRAAIVRGGAAYQPRGSIWYFPQTYRLDEHQKYLLMSPGRDRSATIGFRCVVDAQ
ncbi:MAG TPA: SUMF1/EgtB/PvdO family nonheme iron enzyme [Candidatus Sulfotelmatobacter sp.]